MRKNNIHSRLAKKLVQKSTEAFVYSIETFDKPTIKYRVETFCFLICNAWELLLKAYWIETKGKSSIYYPDKPDRTYSLEYLIKNTFTNENDPIRKNLLIVVKVRNTSTHFITEEYNAIYTPFFQSCVLNYIEKIDDFFSIDMNELVSFPFLSVSSFSKQVSPDSFKRKYGIQLYEKYVQTLKDTEQLLQTPNNKIALSIDLNLAVVKREDKADLKVSIAKDSNNQVVFLKETRDVNQYYPYNQKRAIKFLNDKIDKNNLKIKFSLNQFTFQLICKYFNLYNDPSMCYKVQIDSQPRKMFSHKMVEFIYSEIAKDTNLVNNIKKKKKS